jgi:cytochrome c-type biogenesis protein CcmH
MRRVGIALLLGIGLFFSASLTWAKDAVPLAEDPIAEQRLIKISEEMRCLVCQNESLAGSRSDLANDLRSEIRNLIKEGKTDDQIRSFMVERYGDFVLYRPPVKPITWLLWLGPFLMVLAGIAGLISYLKRRNREITSVTLSEEENRRIDAMLQDVKPNTKEGAHD